MVKQEATTTINDDTLLALIASIQSLMLTLHGNLPAMSAQPGLAAPPTALSASTTADPPASAVPAPTSAADTVPAAVPAPLPGGPIPPPPTFGPLSPVYLTGLTQSSRGIHPTVLQALPAILNAPDAGPWFAVTVGRYMGIYQEWHEVNPLVSGWSCACCKRHSSKEAALGAYEHAWTHGNVHGGVHPDHHL